MFGRLTNVLVITSFIFCVLLFVNLSSGDLGNDCDHEALLADLPYLVYIAVNNVVLCTGTALNRNWVLTSAHCVLRSFPGTTYEKVAANSYVVAVQELRTEPVLGESRYNHSVDYFLAHPDYNEEENDKPYKSDIALVKLKDSLEEEVENVLHPIKYLHEEIDPHSVYCSVAGFGLHSYGGIPPKLSCSHLTVFTNAQCKDMDGAFPWDRGEICAQTQTNDNNQHHCVWGSGGPLLCDTGDRMTLAGVVSAYAGPGKEHVRSDWVCTNTPNEVVVFTYIGRYLDWIQSKINTTEDKENHKAPKDDDMEEDEKRGYALTCGLISRVGDFPYVVLLKLSNRKKGPAKNIIYCTGTILSPVWVITAAHCIWPPAMKTSLSAIPATSITVLAGFTHRHLEKPLQVRKGVIFDIHPGFDTNPTDEQRYQPYNNDISLLKLNKPLLFDQNVNKIRVIFPSFHLKNTSCMTIGYGLRLIGKELVLHCSSLRAHSRTDCKQKYQDYDWNAEICADNSKNQQCFRESGGPLVCADGNQRLRLTGLMIGNPKAKGKESRSDVICSTGNYSLIAFTYTAHYFDWITSITSTKNNAQLRVATASKTVSQSSRLMNTLWKQMYVIMFLINFVSCQT